MGSVSIGPFIVPNLWLALLISGLVSYIVMTSLPDKEGLWEKHVGSLLGNSCIVWFLVYKFSLVLFRPSIISTNPKGLLYFTGGPPGMYLGFLITFLYILFVLKRKAVPLKPALLIMGSGFVSGYIAFHLVKNLF